MPDITDITDGTLNGSGHFDKFMTSLNLHIDAQWNLGRIQAADYATVYLGALQLALTQAIQYILVTEQVNASQAKTASETALLDQKTKTELAQIVDVIDGVSVAGAIGRQKILHTAQADGFARDAEQKATKILMDAWSVSKSVSGDAIEPPDGARNDDLEDMIIKLREGIGITESIYKFGASAGPDQTQVPVSSVVTLNGTGSVSDTPTETIVSYLWEQINGPNVTVANSLTAIGTFTADATPAVYEFRLTITSSLGNTSMDTVKITTV